MKCSLVIYIAYFIFALVPLESTNGKPPTALEQKLKDIQIPGVQFFESPMDEVMQELQRQAKKFDLKEKDPAKKGVNIIALPNEPFPNVTITLNSMPLGQLIQFITESKNWTYDVRADAIVVSKSGETFRGRPLGTEFYELTQGTINQMTGGGGAGAGGNDPFNPNPGGGGGGADDQGAKIKVFLEGAGIPFDETKGHKFVFDGFQMIVTHERSSLDLIEKILRRMDVDRNWQVSVTFKLLEAPLGLIEEVLSKTAKVEDDKKFSSIMNRESAERLIEGLLKDENVELLHAPNILIMDGQPTQYYSAQEVIYPTDFIPPLESNQSKPSQPIAQFDTVGPDDEQPGFRKVGLIIALTPRVEKYQTISLELSPKLTRLMGHEDYGQGTKLPVFWSWQINTSVTLGPNETMISRGASSEEKKEIIVLIEASILK